MATFLEIQNAVSDRSKRPKLTDLTEIKREINETIAELAALLKLDVQTSVLVALTGTNPFSITTAQPTGLGLTGATGILTIVNSLNLPLSRIPVQQMIENIARFDYGDPVYAIEGQDKIYFNPDSSGATGAMTVTWTGPPATLTADGDTPTCVPLAFHDAIIWGASARAVATKIPELASAYEQRFRLVEIPKIIAWQNRSRGDWGVVQVGDNRRTFALPGRDVQAW